MWTLWLAVIAFETSTTGDLGGMENVHTGVDAEVAFVRDATDTEPREIFIIASQNFARQFYYRGGALMLILRSD